MMTFGELAARFLSWSQANQARKTWENYTYVLARLPKAALRLPLHKVTVGIFADVRSTRHLVAAVKRVFNWGRRVAGLVKVNPLADFPLPPERLRNRIFSAREQARLLRAAPMDFRAVCLACRETGARPQEVRVLEWDDLRFDRPRGRLAAALRAGEAYFYLADHKARHLTDQVGARVIPITKRLGRLLLRLAQRCDQAGKIFLRKSGLAWTKDAICKRLARLRRRLQCLRARGGESVVMYTWRHTRATAWAAAGLNGTVLSHILGHHKAESTRRYIHLTPQMMRGALKQIGM